MKKYDLVIIGGGSAGLGAAIEAYKSGVPGEQILIIEYENKLGGILNQCIHTGFGLKEFKEELTGPEYAHRFIEMINETNINVMLNSYVTKISKDRKIEVSKNGSYEIIQFSALIYAAGCLERSAGAIKLNGDRPKGVMSAGQAQNYLNNLGYLPGKNVFILGSGDIGLIMARRMTLEGAKVIGVAELMPYSNGLKRNIVQCLDDYDIPLYLSTTVNRVIGKNVLEAIELINVDEKLNPIKGSERIVKCDTLLLSVGLIPNITLLNNLGLEKDKFNRLIVNERCETSEAGIYVCGNALHVHDLVDNVTQEARVAGRFASEYIKGNDDSSETIEVINDNNINYTIPNRINKNSKDFNIKFRVKKPMENKYIIIKDDEKILKKIKMLTLIPSEMIILNVKNNNELKGTLKVEVSDNE